MFSFLDWGSTFRTRKSSKKDEASSLSWPPAFPQSQLEGLVATAERRKVLQKALADRDALRRAVLLPDGELLTDWIALHCVDFLNLMNLLYSVVYERSCTSVTCPSMTAGPRYEFLWSASDGSRPQRMCAPRYIEALLEWADRQLSQPSSVHDRKVQRAVFRRFLRIFSHIYHHHLDTFIKFGAMEHLNTTFFHFSYFVKEFDLVSSKEMATLSVLFEVNA